MRDNVGWSIASQPARQLFFWFPLRSRLSSNRFRIANALCRLGGWVGQEVGLQKSGNHGTIGLVRFRCVLDPPARL